MTLPQGKIITSHYLYTSESIRYKHSRAFLEQAREGNAGRKGDNAGCPSTPQLEPPRAFRKPLD